MSVTQIEFRKKIFEVEYDYTPEEKQVTYYPDGSGYPGCAEQVDICKVTTPNGEDFTIKFQRKPTCFNRGMNLAIYFIRYLVV